MRNQQLEVLRKACEVCDGIANAITKKNRKLVENLKQEVKRMYAITKESIELGFENLINSETCI